MNTAVIGSHQGVIARHEMPLFSAKEKEENKKEVYVLNNNCSNKHALASDILLDDDMQDIMKAYDASLEKSAAREKKIAEYEGQIADKQDEIKSYQDMIQIKSESITAIKILRDQVQQHNDEVTNLRKHMVDMKSKYETKLEIEQKKVAQLEKDLKGSNRNTYRTFKEKKENEIEQKLNEKDDEILGLKQRVLELEKENTKLKNTDYIGTSKKYRTNEPSVLRVSDCVNTSNSIMIKDMNKSSSSVFLMKLTVRDSNNKERILIRKLVSRVITARGSGQQMRLYDIMAGKPVELSLKDEIVKLFESNVSLLEDEKLSQFFDMVVKIGEKTLTYEQIYKTMFESRAIFSPVNIEKIFNFKQNEVK